MPKQNFDYHGWVDNVGQTRTVGQNSLAKRDLIVTDRDGKYPQFVDFEFIKDNTKKLDGVSVGDEVVVTFNVRGREYNGRYYNTLSAVDIQVVSLKALADEPPAQSQEDSMEDAPF